MAYVRKTEQLLDDIMRQVRSMAEAATRPYNDNEMEIGTPEWDSACELAYKTMYADAPDLRGKLPASWLEDKQSVRLVVRDSANSVRLNVRLEAAGNKPFAMPKVFGDSYYTELKASYNDCDAALREWIADAQNRRDHRTATLEKFRTVEQQLAAFMRQHASLNSAVKDMPEIEMYVPAKYIERLRAPSAPRSAPSKVSIADEVGIDRDALATMAIAHRIIATQ